MQKDMWNQYDPKLFVNANLIATACSQTLTAAKLVSQILNLNGG